MLLKYPVVGSGSVDIAKLGAALSTLVGPVAWSRRADAVRLRLTVKMPCCRTALPTLQRVPFVMQFFHAMP
jgi:hypothetical protein